MKLMTALLLVVLCFAGCTICSKGGHTFGKPDIDAVELFRTEEILAAEMLADRTISSDSIDYLFRDRRIYETDTSYEVYYTKCMEVIWDTLPWTSADLEKITVRILKKSLEVKGPFFH